MLYALEVWNRVTESWVSYNDTDISFNLDRLRKIAKRADHQLNLRIVAIIWEN